MKKKKKKRKVPSYVSTGCTLLNLMCTGNPFRGFRKGGYYRFVGDSFSGKTFLGLTCFAEAAKNKNFDEYRLIFDNAEGGAIMDIRRLFGAAAAARIEPPAIDNEGEPVYSSIIEEFYYHIDDALVKGIPFIYVLDSMDCLSSKYEGDKFQETKTARRKGRKVTGSYGDGKAKINSMFIRRLMTPLRKSGSILIVLSQTRDNFDGIFETKTWSGGHSLKFYGNLEVWTSIKGMLTKTVRGRKIQQGILCKCKVKKNRETGRVRETVFPIYHSYGIDDIGSCVDFLVETSAWEQKGSKIHTPLFDKTFTRHKLIEFIEQNKREKEVQALVGEVWAEIEERARLKRRPRYT